MKILTQTPRQYIRLNEMILGALSYVSTALRPLVTEEVQLTGAEHLNEHPVGPYLWLLKHESWNDVINLAPLYRDIPGTPPILIASKTGHTPSKLMNWMIEKVFQPVLVEVHRTNMDEGKTPEQVAEMRAKNEQRLERIRHNFGRGIHALMFPEGTTVTDGAVLPIKAGCYNLAKMQGADGELELVTCIPVGLTYDFLSGDRSLFGHRDLLFVNVGSPFHYAPAERAADEPEEAYVKRDIHAFTDDVHDRLVRLSTITAAQLASMHLLRRVEANNDRCSEDALLLAVASRAEKLATLDGINLDDALRDPERLTERVHNTYRALERRKFITNGTLDEARIYREPERREYRAKNIIRYSANRLHEIAQMDARVREILSGA